MPKYDFKCECGEKIERDAPMSEAPKKVKCPKCGKMADRDWSAGFPAVQCRYSYFERAAGNPRVNRGKGR